MVLAREESIYIHKQIEEQQQSQIKKNKKKKKNYRFEKILIIGTLGIVLVFSMLLLKRFIGQSGYAEDITEAKHRVNSLQNQIVRLETEKEKLRVEVETVSRSGWIESEAKSRLEMIYPTQDQVIHININPAKVAMIASEIDKTKDNNFTQEEESKISNSFFTKLASYIGI